MKIRIVFFLIFTYFGQGCVIKDVELYLATPKLKSPISNVTINCCSVHFYWEVVPNATFYELQLSMNPNFTDTVFDRRDLDCSMPPTVMQPAVKGVTSITVLLPLGLWLTPYYCMQMKGSTQNGQWYWRVKANGNLQSKWSETGSFMFQQ